MKQATMVGGLVLAMVLCEAAARPNTEIRALSAGEPVTVCPCPLMTIEGEIETVAAPPDVEATSAKTTKSWRFPVDTRFCGFTL